MNKLRTIKVTTGVTPIGNLIYELQTIASAHPTARMDVQDMGTYDPDYTLVAEFTTCETWEEYNERARLEKTRLESRRRQYLELKREFG